MYWKSLKMNFMRKILIILLFMFLSRDVLAQTDTISPSSGKLQTQHLSSSTSTYVVYWEDEKGNISGHIELWKRALQLKEKEYFFDWKWYRNDTLYAHISNKGNNSTMEPQLHRSDYFKKGKFMVQLRNGTVTIPDSLQTSEGSKLFKVVLHPIAFAFPMDLEILPLLPLKKEGQQFAIAFYEPGSEKSAYYNATIIRKEKLPIPAGSSIRCWVLRMDYAPNSYADFWITENEREVVKMKEFYQGKYRYKVKLY